MDHYVSWHTGDGVATDLLREWTPCINGLIHDAVVLAIHTLSSGTLATLAKIDDGVQWCFVCVDLNLVVGVLDDCSGHVMLS